MLSDENRIFREASVLITGSLEIDQALLDAFAYLRGLMPLDELALFRLDLAGERVAIRTVVRGTSAAWWGSRTTSSSPCPTARPTGSWTR
ncbi:MAG TPA: hypothetical protein PK668_05230 [Myxococcota bacterium]|nr:hypothetical protein [Myxococcota bacterium]HRY92261.1 hypothetical protein [Myxococcota bacterium]HSA22437.1 hypothetical protein [Myxococcota bacterium]